jgi:hypothetical protein
MFDRERAETDAVDLFDRVMLAEQEPPEGFEFGAVHADFVPVVGGTAAARSVGLADDFHFDAGFFAEPVEIGEGKHTFDLELVGLLEMIPVFEKLGGEIAVVGHEHESGSGIFEIADGVDALGKSTQKIAEGFASFGIGERRDDFRRLVEKQIDVALVGIDGAAGGLDFVFGRIGFRAEFGDDLAVDADLAGEDELLRVAAGGDAGASDDFLKAFEHEASRRLSAISLKLESGFRRAGPRVIAEMERGP